MLGIDALHGYADPPLLTLSIKEAAEKQAKEVTDQMRKGGLELQRKIQKAEQRAAREVRRDAIITRIALVIFPLTLLLAPLIVGSMGVRNQITSPMIGYLSFGIGTTLILSGTALLHCHRVNYQGGVGRTFNNRPALKALIFTVATLSIAAWFFSIGGRNIAGTLSTKGAGWSLVGPMIAIYGLPILILMMVCCCQRRQGL